MPTAQSNNETVERRQHEACERGCDPYLSLLLARSRIVWLVEVIGTKLGTTCQTCHERSVQTAPWIGSFASSSCVGFAAYGFRVLASLIIQSSCLRVRSREHSIIENAVCELKQECSASCCRLRRGW